MNDNQLSESSFPTNFPHIHSLHYSIYTPYTKSHVLFTSAPDLQYFWETHLKEYEKKYCGFVEMGRNKQWVINSNFQ